MSEPEKNGLVAKLWDSYRTDVLPADIEPIDERNARITFYAAAHAMHELVLHIEDPEAMLGLRAELDAFLCSE